MNRTQTSSSDTESTSSTRTAQDHVPFDRSWSASNMPPPAWTPYNPRSPWNQRLPANPQLTGNSAGVVAFNLNAGSTQGSIENLGIGFADESNDYFHPIYFGKPTDPTYRVHCYGFQPGDRCAMEGWYIHIPAGAQPAGGTDHHMAVIEAYGREYDFWAVDNVGDNGNGNEIDAIWGGYTSIFGTGLMQNGSATSTGMALYAGEIRAAELAAGTINHALYLVVPCMSGNIVYPATGTDSLCSSNRSVAADAGARFWLDLSDADIDALNLTPYQHAIAIALAHYGAFASDQGNAGLQFQTEAGIMYTSLGLSNPLVTYAQGAGVPFNTDRYNLDMTLPIDLYHHLHVVDPCVTQHSC